MIPGDVIIAWSVIAFIMLIVIITAWINSWKDDNE